MLPRRNAPFGVRRRQSCRSYAAFVIGVPERARREASTVSWTPDAAGFAWSSLVIVTMAIRMIMRMAVIIVVVMIVMMVVIVIMTVMVVMLMAATAMLVIMATPMAV